MKTAGMAEYHLGYRTCSCEEFLLIEVVLWKAIIILEKECFGEHKHIELTSVELHLQ